MRKLSVIFLCGMFLFLPLLLAAFDKDKPAATTSLRQSNPEMRANQSQLQTALDNEHIFTGTSASTQTGDHTQGSARAFFAATTPPTRIDGQGFKSTDLGSIWWDSDDLTLNVLTAIASDVWLGIPSLTASTNAFTQDMTVGGTFTASLTGTITMETGSDIVGAADSILSMNAFGVSANGVGTIGTSFDIASTVAVVGTLNSDTMAGASDTTITTSDSIVKYSTLDADGVLMHDAEGAFNNCDIDGGKTKVYTKYLTGTTAAGATTTVAHGITGIDNILSMTSQVFEGAPNSIYRVFSAGDGTGATATYLLSYDGTNFELSSVGANLQSQKYRIKIYYKIFE